MASKELVKNKFPISWAFRNSAIVPLGKMSIKDDFHVVFEIGGICTPSLVHLVQEPYRHAQAGRGLRPCDALPRNVHRMKDHPLAGTRDMREHLVFDRVMLGTVRRIVGHTHCQPQPIGEPLEVFLEQILRGAVAATTVPQHEQPCRLRMRRVARLLPPQRDAVTTPFAGVVACVQVAVRVVVHHVIDPVRNQFPLARGTTIVVEGFHGLSGEGRAAPVKMPQSFFLFRVDRNHRITGGLILAPQARDVFELCVAVRVVAHRLFLPRCAAAQLEFAQHPPDCASTGGGAQCQQPSRQLAQRQIGPQHAFAHRIASGALLPQLTEVRFQGGRCDYALRASPPCLRMRPAAASSASSRSWRP
jgi:hypothetical protein